MIAITSLVFSLSLISDSSDVHAFELNPIKTVVTENSFSEIGIADVKATESGIYVLYWNSEGDNKLKFITSIDNGNTWSNPTLIENGLEMDDGLSPRIMINENNVIGVLWEDALDPVNIKFTTSSDNGEHFTFVNEFENSFGFNAKDLYYDNQDDTIAVTYSTSVIEEGQLVSTSFDFGNSWTEPVILQNGNEDGSTSHSKGTLEIFGDNMYTIWNAQNGIQTLYYSNSTDNGATWSAPMKLSINEVHYMGRCSCT